MKTILFALILVVSWSSLSVGEPDIYYFHNDHLGTPQVLTDKDQNVVWKVNYDPFGNAEIVVEQIEMPLRMPGQYFDSETGYLYNYYRDYDPTLGRYLQSDPIGLGGGLNTYAYVGGNPLSFTDPQGLCAGICTGIGVGVGLGIRWGVSKWAQRAAARAAAQAASNAMQDEAAREDASDKECEDDDEEKCDMKLVRAMPSYDGKTFTCMYTSKGSTFTFPQAVGYSCPSIDKKRCMVNTNEIMSPARY